jgi:hypothetical protein
MWDLWWTKQHRVGFLPVFRVPLPSISPIAPHSSSSTIRSWYNRAVVASVIVDSVPLHPKRKVIYTLPRNLCKMALALSQLSTLSNLEITFFQPF